MYWYYKYPLLVLGFLVVFGLGYLTWTHLPRGIFKFRSEQETTEVSDSGGAPADQSSHETGKEPPPSDRDTAGDSPLVVSSRRSSNVPDPEILRLLSTADQQLANGNFVGARLLARKVIADPDIREYSEEWMTAARTVSKANTVFANSDVPAPEKIPYIVKEGDSLVKIASSNNTTVGALQRLNGLDPTDPMIYPGNILYLFRGTWSITASKSRFLLLLKHEDRIFKIYPVGLGRQDRTPLGTFDIGSKVREPAWTAPGKNIPFGDPENVLGTRWLGIIPVEDTDPALTGYGIHGTWEPESVGTACSQGCLRMRNEDVEELFELVPIGTRVVIEDE